MTPIDNLEPSLDDQRKVYSLLQKFRRGKIWKIKKGGVLKAWTIHGEDTEKQKWKI